MSADFHGENYWALILGGSSGFGLASAHKLARSGMHLCIVHRDRRGAMAAVEKEFAALRATGVSVLTLNADALSEEGRAKALRDLAAAMRAQHPDARLRLFLHSIAFGNLKALRPAAGYSETLLEDEDIAQTIYAMGTSLVSWVRDLSDQELFAADARVIGLTSEGNRVAWRGYAAVSAAKAALEAISRSIALEFAPQLRSNILQPGVTDTPALRLIPGGDQMLAAKEKSNPMGRTTTPEDVAGVVALMASDEAAWINGAVLRVDGGEGIAS
ncbi:MAG: SDR family oxidoreductase [Leptospirales bacterium]|jgi:NAD(P)-dependent dehydrogenase (short-subunit alcohol dehydrogenase family)